MEEQEKIAIYCGKYAYGGYWDERNLEIGHIGGSEIWAIELSKEFSRRGYKVYLFGECESDHISNEGVEYVRYEKFRDFCFNIGFDHIIASRKIIDITDDLPCDDISVMCHDTVIIGANSLDDLKLGKKIKRIYVQSYYQKYMLQFKYNIPDCCICNTSEGIDIERYSDVDKIEKKNKMLWSSGKGRGIMWLIEHVLPLIRAEVPDFEINVCGYFDEHTEDIFRSPGVNVLGNITKDNLVKEQKESKIWIYPNHGLNSELKDNEETFSITAIENGAAKNALILSDWGCWFTTLKGYNGFIGNGLFENPVKPMDMGLWDEYAKQIAERAIKCLKDEEYRKSLASSAYEVSKKYTWSYVADSFINSWK